MRWSDIERANALTVTKIPEGFVKAGWSVDPDSFVGARPFTSWPSRGGSVGASVEADVVVGDAGPEAVVPVPKGASGTFHMTTTPGGDDWLREMFLHNRSA